jgi:hypothetical protein
MQTVNNLILNTNVAAADGAWRNVSNFVASSIQIIARDSSGISTALTGTITIEVSNDPNVNIDNLATQIAAPSAPVLTAFTPTSAGHAQSPNAGGGDQPFTYPAATYGVKLTYVTLQGETVGSAATSLAVAAGKTISVAGPGPDGAGSPPTPSYAIGYNVYVSVNGGPYILQNPPFNSGQTFGNLAVANGPISVNQAFILYAWQNNLIQPPVANTTGTPNIGANISGNLNAAAVAGVDNEAAVSYDTATGLWSAAATMVMWSPSCLYFNWVRARVSGQTAGHVLQAYLFGQNG